MAADERVTGSDAVMYGLDAQRVIRALPGDAKVVVQGNRAAKPDDELIVARLAAHRPQLDRRLAPQANALVLART